MVLTIQHVRRLTDEPADSTYSIIGRKIQISTFVSIIHVFLILTFTVAVFLVDNVLNNESNLDYQMQSLAIFLGGMLDIFIAYVMFFVLDDENEATDFVMDMQTRESYQIMDVINVSRLSITSENSYNDSLSDEDEDYGNRNVHISIKMLSNFINVINVDESEDDFLDLS